MDAKVLHSQAYESLEDRQDRIEALLPTVQRVVSSLCRTGLIDSVLLTHAIKARPLL